MNKFFNIFPNSKTIAHYSTFRQLINLNSVTQEEFDKAMKEGLTDKNKPF